ncbi:hypothetical protein OsI_27717 [Oryza sativa Indica Group]|uniref:Uncharacterized protein n=1 Tax=Oryza sativa subsp. indica TaxID=39946 RepID=A2YQZ1_ORYSI|nr:hypothetical protein OsI_27717 [Oryza sativa Indica Group]
MAGPDKKKGKGKEKVVEDQEPPPSPEFELNLNKLTSTYRKLMEEIPAKLETILNQQAEKENTKFEKIAGKLCTPPKGGGTFLVRLVPRRESNFDEPVYLLFRWKDLYFEAFYSRGKWYRLKDHEEKLPPRSQLPYSEKPDEGIYVLMNTTSYGSIGGSSVVLGPRAWDHCHVSFLKADDLVRQSNKKPLTSESEGTRSWRQSWILEGAEWIDGGTNISGVSEISSMKTVLVAGRIASNLPLF